MGLSFSVSNGVVGDVPVYESAMRRLLEGQRPYADFAFEYPPLSLALALVPALFGEGLVFRNAFASQMLALHLILGALLLREGRRHLSGWLAVMPFGLLTGCAVLLEYVYLKRFDLAPSLVCVLALLAAHGGRHRQAGLWLAIGVGLKLYPVVLVPLLMVLAWRAGRLGGLRASVTGIAVGSVPLVVAALAGLPWWRMVAFHTNRGLQAESLGGSMLWLAHHFGLAHAEWTWVDKWVEIAGPGAPAVRFATSLALLVAVPCSVAASVRFALKAPSLSLAQLARAALVPMLGLLVFASVLSPQFLIWVVGLAALSLTDGRCRSAALVLAALALVPLFYPSKDYGAGLRLLGTVALVLRNALLGVAWVDVMFQMLQVKPPSAQVRA